MVDDSGSTPVDETPTLILARLADYFGRRTSWQRRLWNPGSVVLLAEVIETLRLSESQHLHPKAAKDLMKHTFRQVGPDPGVGDRGFRKHLNSLLKSPGDALLNRRRLEDLIEEIRDGYLERWHRAASGPDGRELPTPEPSTDAVPVWDLLSPRRASNRTPDT